ncbi:efflux RND transporter permease subunit VmeI [Aurantivibrio plasticivorans]
MNIGEYSVKNPVVSWLFIIILVGGGLYGFEKMGKLEDPSFTIKKAKVITHYPGATARQVQDEVTYHIEDAIQKLEQVKNLNMSISRPGYSEVSIEFKDVYRGKDFPAIYDELRRKITDAERELPPGAKKPIVVDDFADVYGVYIALTGEGYTYRDLKDTADNLKKQLVLVSGVRKIVISGDQQEVVYVEVSRAKLGELGIPISQIAQALSTQNKVVSGGNVTVGREYLRIQPTGEFLSVRDMGDTIISDLDGRQTYLRDIATIRREYREVPRKLIYLNGKPAITLGISMLRGENVIDVGAALNRRIAELDSIIPAGIEFNVIYDQPSEVDNSVNSFLVSVGQAIAIVIVVLLFFMGLRTGLIIGTILLITVSGTLWIMQLQNIQLQRISLGALVIALGMLVDNAIVVAEGMLVRLQAGMSAVKAAGDVVRKNIWALLGGTVIGIVAFSPIGLSPDSTGEFAGSLFQVIFISLLLSWFTAISSTPLLCGLLIKPGRVEEEVDPYAGKFFVLYKRLVAYALHHRRATLAIVVAMFVASSLGFGFVKKSFFPDSNTPMFFVDIWERQGTDIRMTRDDALKVSEFLRAQPGVEQTTTIVGGGDQRFSLVFTPKEANPAYAQIIVKTKSREHIAEVWRAVDEFMVGMPNIDPLIKALRIGPGRDSKIEARFHGPDPVVLRDLASQAEAILRADAGAKEVRNDWRQLEKVLVPVYSEQRGRNLGIGREEVAVATAYAFGGMQVGIYRDGNRLLPIQARAPRAENINAADILDLQVWSPVLNKSIPLAQVIDRIDVSWENTEIRSRNRAQTIIASANPIEPLAEPLFNRIRPQVEAIPLPSGYSLSWGGEYEDSQKAQKGLSAQLPMGFLTMILISILLFGKLRQPLIIWFTVPLAIIGITVGLLSFRGAFDFMAILGALSLIGLLIKNAIVLIEEIDQQIAEGLEPYFAIIEAAVSRMRPVLMAASTTILGMIPLLGDVFFVNMSITIMAGLAFATVLTLIIVPVLYAILFRVVIPEDA